MNLKIALAGNPNSGKTTLFNALTGSNQFVGNWPGVTVEKKEGKLKKHEGVTVTDLPGIYSLSPYTLEEVIARNYLISEHPNVILNIIDGTNLERNLYLTTQLMELEIPMVAVVNMMDLVRKNKDKIDIKKLSEKIGVPVLEISALKNEGIMEAAEAAIEAAKSKKPVTSPSFSNDVEAAIDEIQNELSGDLSKERQRWFAIKFFERDEKVLEQNKISSEKMANIEKIIAQMEEKMDDDAESILTNERYALVSKFIQASYQKKNAGGLTISDKIDKIVTNRWLGLPIFAVVMFLIYYISMVSIGSAATDWANDGVFGDGWHLLGIGSASYSEAVDEFTEANQALQAYLELDGAGAKEVAEAIDTEAEGFDFSVAKEAVESYIQQFSQRKEGATTMITDEETLAQTESEPYYYKDLHNGVKVLEDYQFASPDPADFGVWVPGVPVLIEEGLDAIHVTDWLKGLILDGIVAGVGAVLGFVPQMLVLFLLLAFLEACGYMARIAFVLDRIFRRFGLSGKSFIPILIGTGCGIPGIMASRTIENEKDRRMTIMTTTFIPCGAKIPFISMIAGAVFHNSPWIATSAYFIGLAAIILSGIMLKKTKPFAGDPAPFVMELPAYHLPTLGNVLRSMWERGWSFIKKAGTIILLSTIFVWFTTFFGFVDGSFRMLDESEISHSLLAMVGNALAWLFRPLGWGSWQATVAAITGLIAKENIVGTIGILYGGGSGTVYENIAAVFTPAAAFSFLVFNLLCAPCFAAMGAIKREMNNGRWFAFAVSYQCIFAYCVSLIIYQITSFVGGNGSFLGLAAAILLIFLGLFLLFRQPVKKQKKMIKSSAVSS